MTALCCTHLHWFCSCYLPFLFGEADCSVSDSPAVCWRHSYFGDGQEKLAAAEAQVAELNQKLQQLQMEKVRRE